MPPDHQEEAPALAQATSPMMAQYLAIKAAHPDSILFYRMGDFYEMFFDDARAAAAALDIALTKRGFHQGKDIPMCGVPVSNHEVYLSRLIRKGFKVALCEQVEDPAEAKKRGSKSVVKRDIVRIITPGTLTEDHLLEPRKANYLAALAEAGGALGLSWFDLSTGELWLQPVAELGLAAALARVDPGELLLPEKLVQRPHMFEIFHAYRDRLTVEPDARFDSENGRRRLAALYGVDTLDGFGRFGRAEVASAGALAAYVELTQKGRAPQLQAPRRLAEDGVLEIDPATRRNLELTRTLSGERQGSLLAAIDQTVTAAGARLLAAHLSAPLTDAGEIDTRLDAVAFFHARGGLVETVRRTLAAAPDIERALGRLALGRGGPRELGAIRDGILAADQLRTSLPGDLPATLGEAKVALVPLDTLVERLTRALKPEVPLFARDGNFIAAGYSADLDRQRSMRDDGRRLIAEMQARYAGESGVTTLKIKHNQVIGYHIEVTATHADKMATAPQGPFIHRQTLGTAVRFTTVELAELDRGIAEAADRALAIELAIFQDLVAEVAGRAQAIGGIARAMAAIDLASALALLAIERGYVRPTIDRSTDFRIVGGRHPVIEAALAASAEGGGFVANDCALSADDRLWLLTGPNMAGKSTFLRQNALIAILAQMGSFVPAQSAEIGIVDRLFSRVGAADDLASGRSTFMVEMVETAAILNQATPRSLVILDEIGRGTATYDGVSIAWATVEHLHDQVRCRALFATHYHELTALERSLAALSCHTMSIKEWQGDIVFLHGVVPGVAERSYGVHVARLAGLPPAVVRRAEAVLKQIESSGDIKLKKAVDDLPLFSMVPPSAPVKAEEPSLLEPLGHLLAETDPDALTPRDALDLVYRLRKLLP
ncbi:MAG TPA: DNA mismatch repair protein MutS [Alphaproteobacteria bacterium]|jgi:DNA mismatch repair protein MutS|nr:DNA mismatch repair protein MutS [Alphaproteobacteria bacterium]